MKIYAKQIPPEQQDGWRFMEDSEELKKLTILVRRKYELKSDDFARVSSELNELAEEFDDQKAGRGWYNNFSTACYDLIRRNDGKKYSTQQIHRIKEILTDYGNSDYRASDEQSAIAELMTVMTGKQYFWKCLRGCCQGDWADVCYPADDWTVEQLNYLETCFWNTGTEIEIDDTDSGYVPADKINGYVFYSDGWNADKIKKDIAEQAGCKPEDVVYYEFDGYTQIPRYKVA